MYSEENAAVENNNEKMHKKKLFLWVFFYSSSNVSLLCPLYWFFLWHRITSQCGKTRILPLIEKYFVKTPFNSLWFHVIFSKMRKIFVISKLCNVFCPLGLRLRLPSQITEDMKKKRLTWLFRLKLRTLTFDKTFTVCHPCSNCIFESYRILCVLINCMTNFWRLLESPKI